MTVCGKATVRDQAEDPFPNISILELIHISFPLILSRPQQDGTGLHQFVIDYAEREIHTLTT